MWPYPKVASLSLPTQGAKEDIFSVCMYECIYIYVCVREGSRERDRERQRGERRDFGIDAEAKT